MDTWVAVDKDNSEWIYSGKPKRIDLNKWSNMGFEISLPKGTIKKITGKDLTWEDEPIKLAENDRQIYKTMKLKAEIKSTLSVGSTSLEILRKLLGIYGNKEISQSLRYLAFQLQSNYETLRYHLSKLEKYGFLAIDKASTHKCVYHLNVERVKQLLEDE